MKKLTNYPHALSHCHMMVVFLLAAIICQVGCWAPLRSPGIPASQLPDHFRIPMRTSGPSLNFSKLTIAHPDDYVIWANDVLSISIPELRDDANPQILLSTVMSDGTISLAMAGSIKVGGLNLSDAQSRINTAYVDRKILQDPQITISLESKATFGVLVLGQVNQPGTYYLPRYENDVGHAIAAAGGITADAADLIEIHRKGRNGVAATKPELTGRHVVQQATYRQQLPTQRPASKETKKQLTRFPLFDEPSIIGEAEVPDGTSYFEFAELLGQDESILERSQPILQQNPESTSNSQENILKIPMRGFASQSVTEDQISLSPGDVVVVPNRKHEVFYVVGRLSQTNTVRFTIGDRERELGVGFILPRDREIDVVTAVVMAGYIDPIDSPTTVTVQRAQENGCPLLISVDLIAARSEPNETILVKPGDIIYLNPDSQWWWRRTIDRIVPDLILGPYLNSIGFN